MSTKPLGLRRLRTVLALTTALSAGGAWAAVPNAAPTNNAYSAQNTNVVNRATVNYTLAGTAQPLIESSPTGNTTSGATNGTDTDFRVDELIDVLVTEVNGAETEVSPNQTATATGPVVGFWVTNRGNVDMDIEYVAVNEGSGQNAGFGNNNDSIDTGTLAIYEDNGDQVFNTATDTLVTDGRLDDMQPDEDVLLWVRAASIPDEDDGDTAVISLTATAQIDDGAANSDGGNFTDEQGNADGEDTVETVFGDGAGPDDSTEDAAHSDRSEFQVVDLTLTVFKTQSIINDIWSSGSKHLPGNTLRYYIRVDAGPGSGAALNVSIGDDIDVTNLDTATLVLREDGNNDGDCDDGAGTDDTLTQASDGDGGTFATPTVTFAVVASGPDGATLTNGESARFCIDIVIQ